MIGTRGMLRTILFLFVLLFFIPSYNSDGIDKAKLDRVFNALDKMNFAMGSIAVSSNDKIVYRKSIGAAVFSENGWVNADANTRYRIGSVSKVFTAVMVFQLIDEGKLSLNTTIETYFPNLPNSRKITIGYLLSHRSGLHSYTEDTGYFNWKRERSDTELLKIVTEYGEDFEPNSMAQYSNTNYLLLSILIEKIDRVPYSDALRNRITSKLGLLNTFYSRDNENSECKSYKYWNYKWTLMTEPFMRIHKGAGAIISTPTDLITFINALFSNNLVSQRSLNRMVTIEEGYGMGLFPIYFKGRTGYVHHGKIAGFSSSLIHFPEFSLSIAYCSNGVVYPKEDILNNVLGVCFNEELKIQTFNPVSSERKDLDKFLGVYKNESLTIICTRRDKKIFVETKGMSWELEQIDDSLFMNSRYGYFYQFFPQKRCLDIKEMANVYSLKSLNTK